MESDAAHKESTVFEVLYRLQREPEKSVGTTRAVTTVMMMMVVSGCEGVKTLMIPSSGATGAMKQPVFSVSSLALFCKGRLPKREDTLRERETPFT